MDFHESAAAMKASVIICPVKKVTGLLKCKSYPNLVRPVSLISFNCEKMVQKCIQTLFGDYYNIENVWKVVISEIVLHLDFYKYKNKNIFRLLHTLIYIYYIK